MQCANTHTFARDDRDTRETRVTIHWIWSHFRLDSVLREKNHLNTRRLLRGHCQCQPIQTFAYYFFWFLLRIGNLNVETIYFEMICPIDGMERIKIDIIEHFI